MAPGEDLWLFTSPDQRPPIPKKKIFVKREAKDLSLLRTHKRARVTTACFSLSSFRINSLSSTLQSSTCPNVKQKSPDDAPPAHPPPQSHSTLSALRTCTVISVKQEPGVSTETIPPIPASNFAAAMELRGNEEITPMRPVPGKELARGLRSAARTKDKNDEVDGQPAQLRSVSIRRSERIPSKIQSESREETEKREKDEDFWSGKIESNECPRCELKVAGNTARKRHYKMFHYDFFFLHAPNMNDVERWVSCRVGDAGAGSSRDTRVCLHCNEGQPMYNGRIPLLKHIKEAHRDIFLRLKTSYRLFSRTRRPENMLVNRMLN